LNGLQLSFQEFGQAAGTIVGWPKRVFRRDEVARALGYGRTVMESRRPEIEHPGDDGVGHLSEHRSIYGNWLPPKKTGIRAVV
jgi:hypothetical protein